MNALLTLLLLIPFLLPVALANVAERERSVRVFLMVYLGILAGLLLAVGVFSVLAGVGLGLAGPNALPTAPNQPNPEEAAQMLAALRNVNWGVAAVVCLIPGVLALLALVPAVRRAVARVLPIHPDSAVHTTALSMTAVAFGLNLFQLVVLSPILLTEAVSNSPSLTQGATYFDILIFPLLVLTIAAVLGVGLYTRRNQTEVFERLGLSLPTPRQIVTAVFVTVGLLGLSIFTNWAWQQFDPTGFQQVGSLSEALMGNFTGLAGALAIGLSAAIGEELFFRGAYQPRMGVLLATLLFTTFHVQYSFSPATLLVFVIGLVLAFLRNKTSTTVCIMVHFLYNFTLVLLASAL